MDVKTSGPTHRQTYLAQARAMIAASLNSKNDVAITIAHALEQFTHEKALDRAIAELEVCAAKSHNDAVSSDWILQRLAALRKERQGLGEPGKK